MKKVFFFAFLLFFSVTQAQTLNRLPTLNIDKNKITVSGVSAGAFMAIQLNVALSSVFVGAASVAGGVYWCAEDNVLKAQWYCMKKPSSINVSNKIDRAKKEESQGNIEPLKNLKKSKIYIYAGTNDSVISNKNTDKTLAFYEQFTPKKNILVRTSIPSGHGWVTNDFGNSCESEEVPWLNNCHFDMAGEILSHLYGSLRPLTGFENLVKTQQLFKFDQHEFNTSEAGLYDYGWVYVPKNCTNGRVRCKLHVALHGCQMNPDYIQDQFVTHSGLNNWAEANNIVVLYPQDAIIKNANPYACWDWWGYTGSNYANRNGPQIVAIQKMVYRLIGLF